MQIEIVVEIIMLQLFQIYRGIKKIVFFFFKLSACIFLDDTFDINRSDFCNEIGIYLQSYLPVMLASMLLAELWHMMEHPLMWRK